MSLIIGIDAVSIRQGGGVTHLSEILNCVNPKDHDIHSVVVWACQDTLSRLPDQKWLIKKCPDALNKNLLSRTFWQIFHLGKELRSEGCNLLFIPGASYVTNFAPAVCMSQNLIPFDNALLKKLPMSFQKLKMMALQIIQIKSFKRCAGIIFLSSYSMSQVEKYTGQISFKSIVIPHGLNRLFFRKVDNEKSFDFNTISKNNPQKIIYVSNIASYKNQQQVLKACKLLIEKGYSLELTLVGPGLDVDLNRLKKIMRKVDPDSSWSNYLGVVSYESLPKLYMEQDIAIFASSCETFGITLLEKMASGLPIACSNMSSMPEILEDGGIYFDPNNVIDISNALESYLLSPALKFEKIQKSGKLAQNYSWEKCSIETFKFLSEVAKKYKK